jgi:acyl-CoA dehydrogenase
MHYQAPVKDIRLALKVAGLDAMIEDGLLPEVEDGLTDAILEEAGKFATDRIAPLNHIGDKHGAQFKDGRVIMPPGWKETYQDWAGAGWNGLIAEPDFGGQGLPHLLQSACGEMWTAASMAFALGPVLTAGAIEALQTHGSEALKATYLEKLVSGAWMGTMNLTEPQAGSDLNALRARAERADDGSYRIIGQKIYITYGEHDITDNIVHLVLARLPDAPAGTRGISLFVVPKFLVNADGSLGAHNDLYCHSIEHKLGIHASPTCTMIFGDKGGAVGYLVGEENRGLACMFTMMNAARLAVGIEGVGIADRAFQQALSYAKERKQGRAAGHQGEGMSPILDHPDIRRMLLLMKAQTEAARLICYMTAEALDRAHRESDEGKRKQAADRAALLTPIAKAYSTDIGIEMSSLGVQVHGGMGFVEETGAAQHWRDSRIAAIYEGTNGIQAIDLVTRKLPLQNGDVMQAQLDSMRQVIGEVERSNHPAFGETAPRLRDAVEALSTATQFMMAQLKEHPQQALAGATPYLRLFGVAQGGVALAKRGLVAAHAGDGEAEIVLARFFAAQIASEAQGLSRTVVEGAEALEAAFAALAS